MRGSNAEQITYSSANIEHSMLAITENMLSDQTEVNTLIMLLRGPLNHGELFSQAAKYNISLAKLDKALTSLVGGGLVKYERKSTLIKQTIPGKMVINPHDGTMQFVPDNSNNTPFITVQKVDFKQVDFSGGNVINYRHVDVVKPLTPVESKPIYHTDIKTTPKPDSNTICYVCQHTFTKSQTIGQIAGKDGADHNAHQECIDAIEQRRKLLAIVPSQVIQQSVCPLCNKKLGTAQTRRCVVASKYQLVHNDCFEALPKVKGLK